MNIINSSRIRCHWCNKNEVYINYHDNEWGQPEYKDNKLFEILSLEIFQAGLNFLIILNKRDEYRKVFSSFNINLVANYNETKINHILTTSKIIKNKLKIRAIINNANKIKLIQSEWGSFSNYLWGYVNNKSVIPTTNNPLQDELSNKIYNDMKNKDFKFIGPKICYSFLEATGIYQNHKPYCFLACRLLNVNNE